MITGFAFEKNLRNAHGKIWQWQHTECVEKSLHFSWSIHGTKHLIWGEKHHSMKVVVDSDDWRVVQYQRSS